MGKRRAARQAAVQFHFWRDLHGGGAPEKMDDFWEFCPAPNRVRQFAQPLIDGMIAHLPEIDERIQKYSENYDFRRLSAVEGKLCESGSHRPRKGAERPPNSRPFFCVRGTSGSDSVRLSDTDGTEAGVLRCLKGRDP